MAAVAAAVWEMRYYLLGIALYAAFLYAEHWLDKPRRRP